MINFNDNIISANVGLMTDGITLSGNGTSASPIGVIGNTLHRYERCLFSADTGCSVGNLSDSIANYDGLKVAVNFVNPTAYSVCWNEFPCVGANTYYPNYYMTDGWGWYQLVPALEFNTNTSFKITTSAVSWIVKPFNDTGWWGQGGATDSRKSQCIKEIWGIKYL